MLNEKDLEQTKELLKERHKWKCFFEILSRRYIYIPLIITVVYLIDDPDINVLSWLIKFLKRLAGIH